LHIPASTSLHGNISISISPPLLAIHPLNPSLKKKKDYGIGGRPAKILPISPGVINPLPRLRTWLPFLRRCSPLASFQLSD
jgi:hypothetical protein